MGLKEVVIVLDKLLWLCCCPSTTPLYIPLVLAKKGPNNVGPHILLPWAEVQSLA